MRKNLADCTWHPDNGSDYTWFENPFYRHSFLKDTKPEELEKIQMVFASGVWSVFGVWARAIISARIKAPFPDLGSPHSRFWSSFLGKATPNERNEFLTFLLKAQLAHNPINDRPNRGPVTGFSPLCRKAILDYLNAFEAPCQAPDPTGLTGPFLIYHSHLPDERIVHLSGQFQLAEALPILERYLKIQRRMFQLHTDYCTSPEEVDNLYVETLRALVRIGMTDTEQKSKVLTVLKVFMKQQVAKPPTARPAINYDITGKGEVIWSETLNDGGRGGDMSRSVHMSEILEGKGIPLKHELAAQAIKALEKDGPERRILLDGRTDKLPEFSWILEEDQGQGVIQGQVLYYLSGAILEAIDLPTGKTIFRFYAGQTNSNQGVGIYSPSLSLTAAGCPLVVAQVIPFSTGNGRGWHTMVFDKESGEVQRSFKLAVEPQRAYGPQVWPQKDDSTVFRHENWVWRQGPDGEVLWKHEIDGYASVRCENRTLAILTKKELTLRNVENFEETLTRPITEFFKELEGSGEKEIREDFILFDDRLLLFPRFEGPILSYDFKGNLIWKRIPEVGGYYLNHVRTVGPDIVGDLYGYFCKVSPDGKMEYHARQDGTKDNYLANENGIFMQTDYTILRQPFGKDKPKTLVEKLPSISCLVTASKDYLVVQYFDNMHHIACLPRTAW